MMKIKLKRGAIGLAFLLSGLLFHTAASAEIPTIAEQNFNLEGDADPPDIAALEQVTSVSQLTDVRPTDWAFQAFQSATVRQKLGMVFQHFNLSKSPENCDYSAKRLVVWGIGGRLKGRKPSISEALTQSSDTVVLAVKRANYCRNVLRRLASKRFTTLAG